MSYRTQHKLRLSWMPWLYFSLKPEHAAWARAWQAQVHAELMGLETVEIDPSAFVAPEARIFAEPGRTVRIGPRATVAAEAFLHGPIELGADVSVNHRVSMDGGSAGIRVGEGSRIATGATLYAFDHGTTPGQPVRTQPVRSRGITIGKDVWIAAQAGVTDGVDVGDGAVVAMGAIVTQSVAPGTVVGGVPARFIRKR